MRIDYVDIEGARRIRTGVAVVIDVMRAYTVAAWALHLGGRQLVLMDDVEEAVSLAATIPGALLLKDGLPDARFDLHNSPRQLLDLDVADRVIVQRTTAGTRGAVAARNAEHVYCASFVCASATAAAVAGLSPDAVTFVVSGGHDADEDRACADYIARCLSGERPDAAPYLERARNSEAARDLRDGVARGYAGVTEDDVPLCLELDRFDFAMRTTPWRGQLSLTKAG
ncbi:MAG TPA: 2-phosphosulfolactate phosphatase [Arachnia sp.]|nr:2-phosphosulfolactate phosphatase [Arachnia sp.]HMT86668.1 2-phosphosulfolactate phosphatase [Arachnia sp.]